MRLLTLNSAALAQAQAKLATSAVAVRIVAERAKVEKSPAPAMPKPSLDDVLRLFAEQWPDCFSPPDYAPMRVLKLGAHQDIIDRLPDVKPNLVKRALWKYCSGVGYRRLLVVGATRFDLNGEPSGVVSDSEVPTPTISREQIAA